MRIQSFINRAVIGFSIAASSLCANAYRTTGTSTDPNVWTRNYSGVLAAAKQTGYPILIVVVNSATCGHCHVMNQLTLSSANFAQMERELTFYKLMMDAPNGGEFDTVVSRYYNYFNSGMYPIVGVLRSNGDMYGAFGNRSTDSQDVSLGLRQLIENLAREQGADIWSASGVEPFSTVSVIEPQKLTVQNWAARLKGKTNGVVFDSNQEMTASVAISITAKGKVSAKMVSVSGQMALKGDLVLEDEIPQIKADSLLLKYDDASKTWSGNWGNSSVYASALSLKGGNGVYTAAASAETVAGFVTATVSGGKVKVSGMLGGRNKITVNGVAVVLPADVLSAGLGRWATGSDVAFVPVVKAGKFSGGVAVSAGGAMLVSLGAFGKSWTGTGAFWPQNTDISSLAGKSLRIADLEIPIQIVGANKIAVGENDVSARFSVTVKNGTFKGGIKLPAGKCQFEGVLVQDGQSVSGIGTSYGAGVYKVEIR